jgi:hypothetical protein
MAEGQRVTGTSNPIYNLSSVLFHALEGGASYDPYIEDAEREGDRELVEFFEQVRDEDSRRADRALQLLAEWTPTAARTEGPAPGSATTAPDVSSRTRTPPREGQHLVVLFVIMLPKRPIRSPSPAPRS